MTKINIAKDFGRPYGKYRTDGDYSAERFREEFLIPALNTGEIVEVTIDGIEDGYAASFLEEAFGKLVFNFSIATLKQRLLISYKKPEYEVYEELIWKYIYVNMYTQFPEK